MKKILVIDDIKENLITIKAVIDNSLPNCLVLTALSGKEGLKTAREEQPDAILLDIVMPRMDGFEVCQKLKEDKTTKHIPVVLITAVKTDTKSKIRGLEAGADAFLTKPIEPNELSAQINVMLRIKEAEDKLRAERELLDEKVKERTKALWESKQELNAIFNEAGDGIVLLDKTGKVLRINKYITKIGGFTEDDLVGKRFQSLKMFPLKSMTKMISAFSKLIKGQGVTYEVEVYTKKGEKKIVQVRNSILKKDGKVEGIIVILRDITEQKKAEEKEKEHRKNIGLLSKTAMQFVELPQDKDIYNYIGKQLQEFTGKNSIIAVNSIDKEKNILTTRAIIGMGKLSKKVAGLLGRHPVGITNNVKDEELVYLSDGKLHLYKEGLYGILLKIVPKTVCNSIEKLMNVEKIYTIGFTKDNELFGTIVIFLKKDADKLKNEQMIEAFVKQASIAIQKRQVEEELKKHREHLEELVEERTKELEEKNEKLKHYNQLFEGREFRIKDLKDRVKELEERLGIYDL